MAAKWTRAHAREAMRRTYEIAAELAGDGRYGAAWMLIPPKANDNIAPSEDFWRGWLSSVGAYGKPALSPARITREVGRVRALAEGRLVRELGGRRYVVSQPGQIDEDFATPAGAASAAATRHGATAHTFRVTRIRRA